MVKVIHKVNYQSKFGKDLVQCRHKVTNNFDKIQTFNQKISTNAQNISKQTKLPE